MTSERDIERQVGRFCYQHDLLYYKFTSTSRRAVPDRMILGKGKILFLELKAPGKEPSKAQYWEHNILRGAGFTVEWADSTAQAKEYIKEHFNLQP